MSRSEPRANLLAWDVAAMVPMHELLCTLGFEVNTRTRRCRCAIHRGTNPTEFCWRADGLWFCHSCGRGGDRLKLVMTCRECTFREALQFLAALAGVSAADCSAVREELRKRRQERGRLKAAAQTLAMLERAVLLQCRHDLHRLCCLRVNAARRLVAIGQGEPERFPGEGNAAWEALRLVADGELRTAAAYMVLAFGSNRDRALFSLRPHDHEGMIEHVIAKGYVKDDEGHVMELVL